MIMTNKINEDEAEYGVDSRYISVKERNEEAANLMEARLNRMKNLPKEQIVKAKLVQLKLKMDAYISNPVFDNQRYFSKFLATYVDTIYDKRSSFAKDIDVTAVSLSQVINNHREPSEEFILKLMVHSEGTYMSVCKFQKEVWYQIYFNEKICDTMARQYEWRPRLSKQIKFVEIN